MLRIDERLLVYFRGRTCERCGLGPGEPHHVKPRGHGGGSRLDVACNLISLCRMCHMAVERTREGQQECWRIIESREGLEFGAAEEAVWRLLRTCSRPHER